MAATPGHYLSRNYIGLFDWIQWPAMVITVIASVMIGVARKFKRNCGFLLSSHKAWVIWESGWRAALIVLQVALAALTSGGGC